MSVVPRRFEGDGAYRGRMAPRRRNNDDPDGEVRLPLAVTPGTNGEYVPDLPSAHDHSVARAALARSDETARRLNLDRRTFL